MDLLDPRLAVAAGVAAMVGSERVRRTIGRGAGYVAAGAMRVGSPVVNAGRDMYDEAREVASPNGGHASRRTAPTTT